MLIDNYGRPLLGLRITVTHKCNYKCVYCHMEGEDPSTTIEMEPEEISRIVKVAVKLGIYKIKLTGGEPLIRPDIVDIVREISRIKGIRDLALTTNGSMLYCYADKLAKAGLMRVNVSLPSIKNETYMKITRSRITPEDVIRGIRKAKQAGLKPIKINMVVLKGINDNEICEMIKFARRENVILQLIELEPVGVEWSFYKKHHMDLSCIEKELSKKSLMVITRRNMQNRRKYLLENGVEVEVVKPIEDGSFCMACTRIRLTADGKLKPCLMRNDNLVDILSRIRSGATDKELEELFILANRRREPYWKRGMHLNCST